MRIAVFGTGSVGLSVAELAIEEGHTVTVVGGSAGAAVDAGGIDRKTIDQMETDESVPGNRDPEDALAGPYDVLVEATPYTADAVARGFDHLEAALERDRHAVLANKWVLADRYADVRSLERESDGSLRVQATVGGTVPVLSTMTNIGPSELTGVRGLLNGTANFILSRMATEGFDYEHVLAEAQQLGVAGTDPTRDVTGADVGLQCAILANVLADGDAEFTSEDVRTDGIRDVSGSALELAQEDGRTIRLVGEVAGDGSDIRVGPRLVSQTGPLAAAGSRNVVQLETEQTGDIVLSGRDTGARDTAAVVLRDVDKLAG